MGLKLVRKERTRGAGAIFVLSQKKKIPNGGLVAIILQNLEFKIIGVKQICNESSKNANLLYIKLNPSLPDSLSAKAISNKIILTCQTLIFTDSKKATKCHNVVY
jgi:hypothetical protein